MVKRFSILAMTTLIALPTLATAGGGSTPADLERKIDELSRQLDELKAQMAKQNETVKKVSGKVNTMDTMLEEKSEKWDLASRFQFNGDFRARGDYYKASNLLPAGTPIFARSFDAAGHPVFTPTGGDQHNDTIMTNRLRLNMAAKATEDVEFKGRLAMYKAWGMQTPPNGTGDGFPVFDGNTTRIPDSSALFVDRAYINWNNIGGGPFWLSVGRRPTTDGPPAQLRMNNDSRMGTPIAYMDYPFDGATIGYGYNWGNEDLGSGKLRFCYGRGFENGLSNTTNVPNISDTDFAGFNWDVMQKGPRLWNIQTFGAFNLFNYPAFSSDFVNFGVNQINGPRQNLGNIYHTSTLYMDKVRNLNYFAAGAWSHSAPNDNGMFNDVNPNTGRPIPNTHSEEGYSVYTGVRYDIDNLGLKLGAEYNYGSQYWVAFTPGDDDLYMSKLATRGNAYELYLIYDLPTGEALSKFARTFIRLGWQIYDYHYSGGFDWNVKPFDLSLASEGAKLQAIGQNPVTSANQVYLTFEAYF